MKGYSPKIQSLSYKNKYICFKRRIHLEPVLIFFISPNHSWLYNLWGLAKNENVSPLIQKAGKEPEGPQKASCCMIPFI